jgi:hypothetical protein
MGLWTGSLEAPPCRKGRTPVKTIETEANSGDAARENGVRRYFILLINFFIFFKGACAAMVWESQLCGHTLSFSSVRRHRARRQKRERSVCLCVIVVHCDETR